MAKPKKYHLFQQSAETGEGQAVSSEDPLNGATMVKLGERNEKGYMLATDVLDEWLASNPEKVTMLREHENARIIGEWTNFRKESKDDGVYILADGSLFTDLVQEAAEVEGLIGIGALKGISIGFTADSNDIDLVDRRDSETGHWNFEVDFKKIQLTEGSIVLDPADKNAQVQADPAKKFTMSQDNSPKPSEESPMDLKLVNDAVDKRIEQGLKTFNETLETKLSALDEGIVKTVNEAFESAKTEQSNPKDGWEQFQRNGKDAYKLAMPTDERYVQATAYASPTVASGTDVAPVMTTKRQANFLRPYMRVIPISDGAAKAPIIGDINFTQKAAPGASVEAGGDFGAADAAIQTWVAKVTIADEVPMDHPAFRNAMSDAYMTAFQARQLTECLTVARAAMTVSRQVNTGVAMNLPAAGSATQEKFYELVDKVDHAYHIDGDTLLVLSGYARGRLGASLDGGFAWDPTTRLSQFDAYPIKVTGNVIQRGATANHISAIFGNWMQGMTLFERQSLDIMAFEETDPGYVTFFAQGRFKPVVTNGAALAALITKA